MSIISIGKKNRKTEVEIHHLFNGRWSPRSMTGEEMTQEELLPLFEAAKSWKIFASKGEKATKVEELVVVDLILLLGMLLVLVVV